MRYEDMVADPKRELATIARFLGIAATLERLEKALERSSGDQMRKLEKLQAYLWSSTRDTRKECLA
jgi:Sulfotransferase domain